jgi:hypothetical protein
MGAMGAAAGRALCVGALGLLLFSFAGAMTGCTTGAPRRASDPLPGEEGTPYLLGMRFPSEPTSGYFPLFDGQLHGVCVTDSAGNKFVLGFADVDQSDRRLSLATRERHEQEGEVLLHPGGAAERAVLEGLRDALQRSGPATIAYAPEWLYGLGLESVEMFADPLRYAELVRRLANDDGRRRELETLQARVELAAARSRLMRATGGVETSAEGADDWWKAMRALSQFYGDTAREYGLLGTPRPRRDERAR